MSTSATDPPVSTMSNMGDSTPVGSVAAAVQPEAQSVTVDVAGVVTSFTVKLTVPVVLLVIVKST